MACGIYSSPSVRIANVAIVEFRISFHMIHSILASDFEVRHAVEYFRYQPKAFVGVRPEGV